jgi:hypothetical protein
MEIKHTIEILTKDIQDIENLVRNLNKYPTPPRIEIDLAMAKLRNVYELLAMISSDLVNDMEQEKMKHAVGNDNRPEKTGGQLIDGQREVFLEQHQLTSEQTGTAMTKESSAAQQVQGERLRKEEEPVIDESREVAGEVIRKTIPEKREAFEESSEGGSVQLREEVEEKKDGTSVQKREFAEEKTEETAGNLHKEQVPEKFREEVKKASIIAEKFAANKSINEKIAPVKTTGLSSKLTGEPIDSIKRNIGINDRFLIIRELLNGDNEAYNQLVQKLDACDEFNHAFGLLEKNFPDKMDHEGVDLLVRLSRRRFL